MGSRTMAKIIDILFSEATYKGKTVPLNKPMAGDVKKSKVYVDPDGDGKAQKVNFGDKTLSIKKNIPDRKKSYCARSGGQGNLNDKTSANYWSRKAWNCEELELDEAMRSSISKRNTKKLISKWHDDQQGQTYGDQPYSSHPKSVMNIGKKVFGSKRFGEETKKVALLHDVLEDTPVTPEQLSKRGFSDDVIGAVKLLSKDKSLSYEDNIRNIANGTTPAHKHAQMVKYSDNMSNYLAMPKPEWSKDRVEKQKGKYMDSMRVLGKVLGVNHHERLNPKWKSE
jgi:hypothetical protein